MAVSIETTSQPALPFLGHRQARYPDSELYYPITYGPVEAAQHEDSWFVDK